MSVISILIFSSTTYEGFLVSPPFSSRLEGPLSLSATVSYWSITQI